MDLAIEVHDLFVERAESRCCAASLRPTTRGTSQVSSARAAAARRRSSARSWACRSSSQGHPRLRRTGRLARLAPQGGYVTQSPSIYADLTVRENVRSSLPLYGLGKEAVVEAIESVGLQEQTDQMVGTLSGGQHGRVSLACALVAAPEILVLDEPTVGLDPV